jgi:hypothetical protein
MKEDFIRPIKTLAVMLIDNSTGKIFKKHKKKKYGFI